MNIFKRILLVMLTIILALSFVLPVSASARTLKVDVYMDQSFIVKNGGPPHPWQTRLGEITTNIYGFYKGAFDIEVTFNFSPTNTRIVTSPADDCIGTSFPNSAGECSCHNKDDTLCLNSSTYPCTNFFLNRSTCLGSKSTTSAELLLTAHYLCGYSDGSHTKVRGVTFPTLNQIISMDYDIADGQNDNIDYYYARATLVHELGHLYGVADHYDNGTPAGENDNCIWGDNRRTHGVASNIRICTTCYNTIRANRDKYNH